MNTSIFYKYYENEDINKNIKNKNNLLSLENVMDSIPKNSLKQENKELLNQGKIEWRWRFYKINDKRICEISYFDLKINKRTYATKNSIWREYTDNEIIEYTDKYKDNIVDQYYFYSD